MTLKGDAKFKGKLTCSLKNNFRNLLNFHASSWKSGNLHFDGLLLSKAYKDLDEKVQKSYVSWHWRVMQSLKKNWLLVPKMTWGIWWILIREVASLEICILMYCFCQCDKDELSLMTLKKDPKFDKKLTFYLKNDMRNLVNFKLSSGKSKNLHFDELLL